MPSNREIEKLFDQWNPNGIRAGDRVQVSNSQKYQARVVGLDLDMKNKKVYANLRLAENKKGYPIRVDVADCYPFSGLYPSHHSGG
ncbi:MAG TPA: hypothetical protein DD671_10990 [Balneolaceae bacterium]|jgi:ribonuclease I|nr:hypothetical protein [Balneolaceae bacterium]|tara:strand:- start:135 stop:392 length:258 start_codon:yes stop_codon:yes gene_type:complete